MQYILQIIPDTQPHEAIIPYLISAIVALSTVIVYMALHIKKLTQVKDKALESAYQMHITDHQQIIQANTAALTKHADASMLVAENSKEIADAVNELRLYLAEKLPKK